MTEQLTYRLDQFEGPLDLLLTLISKNKVSITDIPIALICDQYVEYINEAQKKGQVKTVSYELPKAFVVCRGKKEKENTIYITQLSSGTLENRLITSKI